MATTYTDESDSSEEEEPMNMPHVGLARQVDVPRSSRPSRRPSGVVSRDVAGNVGEVDEGDKPVTPVAYMMAWRNSLAAQINQFHESTQWTMPNLPTLPALPPIPDYQDYSMVRRVSSLFPQRPTSRPSDPVSKERWWETLTGSPSPVANAPPAYNELYPHNEGTDEDYSMKKQGALLAAVEAAADLHLSQQKVVAGPSTRVEPIRMYDGKPIKRVEFRQDQKLFFFWVSSSFLGILKLTLMGFQLPVLIIILGLMLRNTVPDVLRTFIQGYNYISTHFQQADRIVEVI